MRRIALGLSLVLLAAGCSGSSHAANDHPTSTTGTVVEQGQLLGWHPMAYLGSNRAAVTIQVQAQAPAGLVVGKPNTVRFNIALVGRPVWASITPARYPVRERDGKGRIDITTEGCPPSGRCRHRPLYILTGTPIPHAPPGGVVTRHGVELHLTTGAVQPGRYDLTLPIRYPSTDTHPTVLDVSDTLHVRFDIYAAPPPSSHCTSVDLHKPTAVIPPAHALTETVVLEGGNTRLDPPPHGYQPRVSATRARRLLSATRVPGGGGEATLVLASLSELSPRVLKLPPPRSAPTPPDPVELLPITHNVVAWFLFTQRVAVSPPTGPFDPRPVTVATPPPPPCVFFEGVHAINANTGAQIDGGGGTGEPDLVHF